MISEIDKALCELRLLHFVRAMWPVLEPGVRLTEGRPLDAICEHLEAVSDGEIRRLLINVPPGATKSMLTNVFWPCWIWGPRRRPSARFLSIAYNAGLTRRDNRRSRILLESERFRSVWPEVVLNPSEQNIDKFSNMSHGFRMASSTGGRVMGERADIVILDDPNDTAKVESEQTIESTLQFFTEVLPTRINDPNTSCMVVIMQRVHARDVSGFILSQELGWEHLCLPMEYESDRRCVTSIGFEDWRRTDGELLWPERFPKEYLESELYPQMRSWGGEFAIAGQMQQRPVSREGGMFRPSRIEIVDEVPDGGTSVRGWDLAATSKAQNRRAAFTSGVRTRVVGGVLYVEDVRRDRKSESELLDFIYNVACADGMGVVQDVPQDPGSAGKVFASEVARRLSDFVCFFSPETGSKINRAIPLAAKVETGLVRVVRGEWNDEFLAEVGMFPRGNYSDQVDGWSRSYGRQLRLPEMHVPAGPIIVRVEDGDQSASPGPAGSWIH